MKTESKADDLRPYRFMNVTLLQWLAILAILGVAAGFVVKLW